MKELSIEEKVKRYDEAIKKLRSLHEDYDTVSTLIDVKEELENIFPELKESEEEKIRKSLVSYFAKFKSDDMWDDDFSFGDVLSWLEKQSEKELDPRYSILDKLIEADDIYQMAMNDAMVQEAKTKAIDALSKLEIGKLLEIEKQGEQKPVVIPKFRIGDIIKEKRDKYGDSTIKIEAIDTENYYYFDKDFPIKISEQNDWELVEQKPVIEMKTPEESLGIDSNTYNKIVDECIYGEQKSIDNLTPQEAMDIAVAKCFEQGKQNLTKKYGITGIGSKHAEGKLGEMIKEKIETENVDNADKVEPKFNFKDGQWIVATGKCTYLITKIDGFNVTLVDVKGNEYVFDISSLEDAHLWTIQDAKDGDVLVNWNNTAFIFKAIEDETVKFHMAYNEKWDTIKTPSTKLSHLGLPEPQFEFHPATKEQRDKLFEKMEEAGYMWDSKNKELQEIENKKPLLSDFFKAEYERGKADAQKPAWSEEDERYLSSCITKIEIDIQRWEDHGKTMIDGDKEIISWLKSLKDRVQPKQGWSDEDYNKIETIACHLDNTDNEVMAKVLRNIRDKYYPIVPQNTWKPSKEQINALDSTLQYGQVSHNSFKHLNSLFNDLKKLKG